MISLYWIRALLWSQVSHLRPHLQSYAFLSGFQSYNGVKETGPCLNIKNVLPWYGIPMLKRRRSWDLLIFNIGVNIVVRRHLYIEPAPCYLSPGWWWAIDFEITSCPGYELIWVRVALGTSCLAYELSWVRVVSGTSCPDPPKLK